MVSETLKRAIYTGHTELVFILLVEISHPQIAETLRMTSDNVETKHKGNTYHPFPFDVNLPSDRESEEPRAQFSVPNVDRQIIELIRTVETPPNVRMFMVLSHDPDVIERGPWDMELSNVPYDLSVIRGTLKPKSILDEPLPYQTFNAVDYPAL